ncbi:hypothetical protein [Geothrix sp.]|uniref:hypothetical protein n=1 Tax=Geothrix sp. TaxID=1962974 RepID=UPI0025C08A34|nr:hypothetical protein [Geothrix sp.]
MSWFPLFAPIAIAVVTFFGVDNPSRAIALLPYFAIVSLIWFVVEGRKGLRVVRTR